MLKSKSCFFPVVNIIFFIFEENRYTFKYFFSSGEEIKYFSLCDDHIDSLIGGWKSGYNPLGMHLHKSVALLRSPSCRPAHSICKVNNELELKNVMNFISVENFWIYLDFVWYTVLETESPKSIVFFF